MRKFFRQRSVDNYGYLFVLPWIIGFLVFTAYPIFYSLYLSFFKVAIGASGINTSFLGLANYIQAFTRDMNFVTEVGTYLQQIFPSAILIVIFSLLIAMMLNQKMRGEGIFRTIFFLPVIISSGPVLQQLQTMGITKIPGLENFGLISFANANPQYIVTGLLSFVMNNLVILLWFTGVPILIFLAALQKQDTNIFEAARIDGAGGWEIFWKITLPNLSGMILINMIYVIVTFSTSSMNAIIGTISSNMFNAQTGLGYSAALSWVYFVIISAVIGLVALVLILFGRRGNRK